MKTCTFNLADDAFSLLRFYLNSYDSLKTEKRSLEKDQKFVGRHVSSKLFVPPVAPCRFRSVRGYRLCWSIGAIELFRSGATSSKTTISAAFLRSLPSLPVLEKGWKSALSTLSRFQSKTLGTGAAVRFRVTALGLSRSSQAHLTDNLTTQFVATALGTGIKNAFGWTVDLENYDVEVVATLIKNATASRTTVVLSLGITLLRATSAQCIAGLLARQRDTKSRTHLDKSNILKEKASVTAMSGSFIIDEIIKLSSKFDEPRVPWSLVRKVIKSDVFRRHYLNRSNSCGETPLILAAKACDSRLVSLILSLGKRKCEDKLLPQPPAAAATTTTTTLTRPGVTQRNGLLKRDHRRYDALMYSCEQGDNSTLSVLLNHKTLTRGFSKLCERCLTVATSAGQHHTLSVILHYLLGIKGTSLHHSLCWPALSVAMQMGNSLTVALLLDFMKLLNRKWKMEADCATKKHLPYTLPPNVITISEEMLSTIFPRTTRAGAVPKTLATRYELSKPFFDSILAVLVRAQVFVQGTDGGVSLGCLTHTIGDSALSFPARVGSPAAAPVAVGSPVLCPEKLQFDAAGRRIRLAFYKKLLDQKVSTPERKLTVIQEDKYDSADEKDDKDDSKLPPCAFSNKEEDDDRCLLDDEKAEKKRLTPSATLGSAAAVVVVGGVGGVAGVAGESEIKEEDRHLHNKQKRPRGGSRLALYEKEKQRWMQHLLEIFQHPSSNSFLCASTVQIVLSYLHV